MDIKAVCSSGEKIEVQLLNEYNMVERTLFYWSKLYTEDLKAGENYSDLNRTIAINILGYNLFKVHQNFHSVYKIQNIQTGELFTNLLEIQCIELPKFSKTKPDMNDPLHRWLLFLTEDEDQQNLMEVFKLDQLVSKADEKLRRLSADEEVIRTYQLREKYSNRSRNHVTVSCFFFSIYPHAVDIIQF
ncbi:Rpn family recombination-promoting nuclease/putative transposase [Metabacillus sp. KIGAM252]|uniref:Rpn family recombination-promoting nuclease/putative transposase n=1 Tax=Metabacillus flavus TaxID=2823519 RepID=A0ABS5LAP8_9BACI|nr:Rpn family recombination-promoting nuclease/putative transposase [Metabacillus flavus]MBS2967802.1 Rpn family recombination-promoting nuclease/putative transposase [Metabacillus flavus]